MRDQRVSWIKKRVNLMNIRFSMTAILFGLSLLVFFCNANANAGTNTNWTKIWSDEFNDTGRPDSNKWTYDVGGGGWGNGESQYYTDARLENARVENGHLIIEARKETYEDSEYTSARLTTKGSGDWKYGKIEVRAKLPTGNGMWPAIWMLPSEWVYGSWPHSGEIDIMENVGYEPNTIHWSIHTESYNHSIGTQKTDKADFIEPYNNYHTYAIEWLEDSIRFLVDDIEYSHFNKESNQSNVWPFDQKFHLLLNVAVGGWGGLQGIDPEVFPQKMYVDYVRVYKKNDVKDSYAVKVEESSQGTVVKSPDLSTYPAGSQVNIQAIPDSGFVLNRWLGTVQDTSSSLDLVMNIDYHQTPEFLRPNEMVSNSQFLAGAVNWGGYGAEMSVDSGVHKTTLPLATANPWDVQISQNGIALEDAQGYTLTVVASASQNKTIKASLGQVTSPWTSYISSDIPLTTTPQTFVIEGTMNVSDLEGRVVLDLGGGAGDVLIKEISVVEKQSFTPGHTSILPSDTHIQYVGRIDFSQPDEPSFAFPGVSISAKFEGTSIAVNLEDQGAGGVTTTNYFNAIVDGGEPILLKLKSGQTTYPIADGLMDGAHTIQIFKRTETSVGKVTFKGFVLDQGRSLLKPQALPSRKIEFIGNSMTSGYGNESSSDPALSGFTALNENNYRAWGAITARNIDAQYHCTSYSGRGLVRNYDGSTSGVLPQIYDRTFADEANSTWDHTSYVPDVVVINLGTNDFSAETSQAAWAVNQTEFSQAYKAFITTLRGHYPNAAIIATVGVMISDDYPMRGQHWTRIQDYVSTMVEEVNANGDNNVFYFQMEPQTAPYGEDWHPTAATHETMATTLTEFIHQHVSWGNLATDCHGDAGGSAYVNDCGLCLGGNTGIEVNSCITTSLQNQLNSPLKLYPNPTHDYLYSSQSAPWVLKDILGQIISEGEGTVIDLTHLPVGIYWVEIEDQVIRVMNR